MYNRLGTAVAGEVLVHCWALNRAGYGTSMVPDKAPIPILPPLFPCFLKHPICTQTHPFYTLDPEDGGGMYLRNVCSITHIYKV
jgi:hypothetical protein